ncbi:hypothetical protein P3T76_001379 [Phytophthora citrophthora]|uniref:ABM domain-containing protein n=1 Tax=Phytophthora citrophthora TaxID=4793 RepID=A0AAD9GYC7_9STRA|nr:hypothetical protein P3T76_001379 [Phytophthora citrophthora]
MYHKILLRHFKTRSQELKLYGEHPLHAPPKMVYTLVVHIHAKEGKDVEDKIRNKLIEASQTYMKDAEVIGWHVMQDHVDTRKWTIVERYERQSSLEIHVANPYYAEFGAYMGQFVDAQEISQYNELDTSKPVHVE